MSDNEQPPKKQKMTTDSEQKTDSSADTLATTKHCLHWVHRKKRFCKMTLAKGKDYCGEHEPAVAEVNGDATKEQDRIPCPLDDKHTIYKKNLRKHLKICNARPKENEPDYIQKNINAGDCGDDNSISMEDLKALKLNDLEDKEFYGVIEKVKDLFGKYVQGNIKTLDSHHTCMDEELAKEEYGKESRKHLVQTSALLGILETEQTILDSTSFVEFGAGKGQLAYYLAKLLEKKQNSQVVLVDRMSLRHKKDNKVEDRSLVQRIRADIIDLCIDKLPALNGSRHCIGVSKHLCGGATDLTLRCIVQAKERHTDFIMIALCCHHRCDWLTFVGKEFFKTHGITPREFAIITKMVSWAICGTGMSRERRKALEEQQLTDQEIKDIQSNQRLSLEERESIGLMCKRVLDYARIEYLRKLGYVADLNYYVSKEVTLENVVLLARKVNNDKK